MNAEDRLSQGNDIKTLSEYDQQQSPKIRKAYFQELPQTFVQKDTQALGIDVLLDVPLSISVELGRSRCFVKDLLGLTIGSVVELDHVAGEPVDVLVNGKLFARGEVVVIDDNFGVKIQELISKQEGD
jgi:flagellar motor switch protein FliN/FliY